MPKQRAITDDQQDHLLGYRDQDHIYELMRTQPHQEIQSELDPLEQASRLMDLLSSSSQSEDS